jgi:RpiR family transcriptional regulator, carbohydrate utilization regulator
MGSPINLIDYLNTNIMDFQKSDAVIAKFILRCPGKVLKTTVTELAEEMGLSDATVIRFCQKIGFKGYYQMKIVLAQSLKGESDNGIKQGLKGNPVSYVSGIVLENISETMKGLDLETLSNAARLINSADCVHFFAAGNSYAIAFDAAYKLSRIGIKTFVSSSPEFQISNAYFLGEKSVAFGVSHSGGSKVVLNAFELAREKGASVILLSNYEKSPLASLADIKLVTRAYKEYFLDSGLVTRICGMYVIDVLFFTILAQRNEDYARLFQDKENSMSDFTV